MTQASAWSGLNERARLSSTSTTARVHWTLGLGLAQKSTRTRAAAGVLDTPTRPPELLTAVRGPRAAGPRHSSNPLLGRRH